MFFHRHRHHIVHAPNLPTKIIPTKIRWRKASAKCLMDIGIPPLNFKTLLESNPPTSRILVRRLAICQVIYLFRFCSVSVISVEILLNLCWIWTPETQQKLIRNSTLQINSTETAENSPETHQIYNSTHNKTIRSPQKLIRNPSETHQKHSKTHQRSPKFNKFNNL